MGWWFRSGMRVLTVGSVHLDTIALSRSNNPSEDVTHIGNITHSVGGSASTSDASLAFCPMFVRRMATVTIWAPEATTASRVSSKSRYLPVPTSSRERYARPAMTSGSVSVEGSAGAFMG